MYYVKSWDTDEVLYVFKSLVTAKRYAKGAGSEDRGHPTQYYPLAYVANEVGECVYNPRFSKLISPALGGLINSRPSDHF